MVKYKDAHNENGHDDEVNRSDNSDEELAQKNEEMKVEKYGGGHNEGFGNDPKTIRVSVNKAHELNHAKCILNLSYNKFEWSDDNLLNFHRPNINEVFD